MGRRAPSAHRARTVARDVAVERGEPASARHRATQAQEGGRGMEVTHGNYVGIDVAKVRLDVVLRPTGEYLGTTNDERGIKAVVRHLRKQEEIALVVLE